MKQEDTRRDSFVFRILRERDRPGWKGWVQHAASGESRYVQTIAELLDFVEQHAGELTVNKSMD